MARSTGDKDIIGRAEGVCEAIDTMVSHAARMVNQVLLHPNPRPYTLKPNTHAIYSTFVVLFRRYPRDNRGKAVALNVTSLTLITPRDKT